ncbi:ABC transporter substrate-binding protein, partial [Chloroflexota bacterium]
VNEAGGLQIGNDTYLVEIVPYDDEFVVSKAILGAKKLVLEDEVSMVVQICSPLTHAVAPFLTEQKMISTSCVSHDVSPDYPYLMALSEISPIQLMAPYAYLIRENPEARTVALTDPNDDMGYLHQAFARAAFEAAGIEIVYSEFYAWDTVDFAPIVTAMMADDPDIMCWDAAYSYHVHLLTEQAMLQGFDGLLAGATCDMYPELVERVGKEYLEGYLYPYPDHDDPALRPDQNAFFVKYNELYPGSWSAVSWEYADNMKQWAKYAQRSGSIDPMTVFSAMKADQNPIGSFGSAKWIGTELMGLDNALVGLWPVVQIQDGKARIVEMVDISEWYYDNMELLISYLEADGLMWYQK